MLIAMSLLAFIMVAAALAIEAAQASHLYNTEKAELVTRARGTLDRIAADVRRSTSILVIDVHTLEVTLADGTLHTYDWDGVRPGNLRYSETPVGGVAGSTFTVTGYVDTYAVEEAGQGCRITLQLVGRLSTCNTSITTTPGKVLY
jgi:hypothetical protein